MTAFADRIDAGEQLAARLPALDSDRAVVVALPRGGVPVGAVIADKLGIPLDVLLIRKVGAPGHGELAVGAVSDGEAMQVTVNDEIAGELGLSHDDVVTLARRELPELERRRALYFGDRPPLSFDGRTVIVVDDGVATGATMREALRVVATRKAAHIILALPVAPAESLQALSKLADETICLTQPRPFVAVGRHYANFDQVRDAEVVEILKRQAVHTDDDRQRAVDRAG